MKTTEWAKKEIELACQKEKQNGKDGEWDYGCACYQSALKAYESLCEDRHSGHSMAITRAILERLLDYKPLTPIEDTNDVWGWNTIFADGTTSYQCNRMPSLFKHIRPDGSVTYSDNDRIICIDNNCKYGNYNNGLVQDVIDEMYPIAMPYMPGNGIRVYVEDFLYDRGNAYYDTIGILFLVKDDERVEVNRFFVRNEGEFLEISKEEYEKRKEASNAR